MKRVLAATAAAIICLPITGCAAVDDSGDSGDSGTKATPDLTVRSRDILKEFEDNEAAADAKYKGKTIKVNGYVSKIDTELIDTDQYVIQVAPPGDFNITSVNCDDQTSAAVSKLKKGQAISVIGAFEDGGDLGIELKGCKQA